MIQSDLIGNNKLTKMGKATISDRSTGRPEKVWGILW